MSTEPRIDALCEYPWELLVEIPGPAEPEPATEPHTGVPSRHAILLGGAALGAAALGGTALGIGNQASQALKPRVEVPHVHGAGGSGPVRDI